MRFLNNQEVAQVLTMHDTMVALDQAYRDMAAKEAVCRPRVDIRIPIPDTAGQVYQWGTMEGGSTRGYFAIRMKSDVLYEQEYAGTLTQEKYCGQPGQYCGLILLLDIRSGMPLAILNDGYLQHLRVGADSGLGVRYMARPDAAVVGMIGSGGMARTHLAAFCEVRRIERVQVYSPTPAHREAYAEEMRRQWGVEAVPCDDPRQVYRGADIVAGCTDASQAVITGEWLEPGTHVTCVGGWPDARTWERVDRCLRFGTASAPIGLESWPVADEYIGFRARPDDPVWTRQSRLGRRAHGLGRSEATVSLAQVLAGEPARLHPEDITFSERGNLQGAQFYAVAGVVYENALASGLGHEVPDAWFLQDIRD